MAVNSPFSVATVTDGRWESLSLFVGSFNERTDRPDLCEVLLIDNANLDLADTREWLRSLRCQQGRLIINTGRRSISTNWNRCINEAANEWILVLNDDIEFTKSWDSQLRRYIIREGYGFYAMCKPNSFSGFAVNRSFFAKHGPFREEYTGGGYEDEDFFLTVARNLGLRTKREVLESKEGIFSLPHEEDRGLFVHKPLSKDRKWHWSKANANREVFQRIWKEVRRPGTDTYQGKGGKHYVYLLNS